MTPAERFAELWNDFLEGDLDDADRAELDALLADPGFLREAVDSYRIHRLLGLLAADRPAADAFVAETMARLPASADGFTHTVMDRVGAAVAKPRVTAVNRRGWLATPAGGLTGLIGIASLLAMIAFVLPARRADEAPTGPAPLASITQTLFPMVAYPGSPPVVGQKLNAGRLALQGGALECTLRNGVVILLEGPGEIELRD